METKKILIIDDSNIDRYLICEYLRQISYVRYEFIEASNAETGLQILDEIIPDCILLDNVMIGCEMNGVDALPFIKKTRNKLTPVIMVTGSLTEELKNKAISEGVSGFQDKMNLMPETLHQSIVDAIALNTELSTMMTQ